MVIRQDRREESVEVDIAERYVAEHARMKPVILSSIRGPYAA